MSIRNWVFATAALGLLLLSLQGVVRAESIFGDDGNNARDPDETAAAGVPDGDFGGDGTDGVSGGDGGSINKTYGDGKTFFLVAGDGGYGQHGGDGGPGACCGGKGGDGGDGGKGGDVDVTCGDDCVGSLYPGDGEDAGDAGDGGAGGSQNGDGGNGGDGGDAGNATITHGDFCRIAYLSFGEPGDAGDRRCGLRSFPAQLPSGSRCPTPDRPPRA